MAYDNSRRRYKIFVFCISVCEYCFQKCLCLKTSVFFFLILRTSFLNVNLCCFSRLVTKAVMYFNYYRAILFCFYFFNGAHNRHVRVTPVSIPKFCALYIARFNELMFPLYIRNEPNEYF